MAIDKDTLIDSGLKVFFIATSIGMALCMTKCIGAEVEYQYDSYDVKTVLCQDFFKECLTTQDRKTYQRKRDDNLKEADFHFFRAKEAVKWIPKMTCREAMQTAWTAAASQMCGGTPSSKLCALIVVLAGNVGMGCYDKYKDITDDLQKAEYYYELYEWYDHVLRNG